MCDRVFVHFRVILADVTPVATHVSPDQVQGQDCVFFAQSQGLCVFQCESTSDSDLKAPLVPIQTRQLIQFRTAIQS